jgi:uroporphyrinogen-III synthase
MTLRSLEGLVIGVTADRRWEEQAALLERRGAAVVHGPTITTQYLEHDNTLRGVTEEVIGQHADYLVANTGVGMRAWLEAAVSWGLADQLLAAFARMKIVARGPKAASVVIANGIDVWARASSERLDELVEILCGEPLAGCRVVIQEHGSDAQSFVQALTEAGATVVEVPIYRWKLPDDPAPARRLIERVADGRVDAVTFTSAPAVHNLFAIARRKGVEDGLRLGFNRGVVAGCVGAVCADGARREGIDAPLAPSVGRLGLLVRALSDHFAETYTTVQLADTELRIQGNLVLVGGEKLQLTPRERGVLAVLAARPGAVISRSTLLQKVWGPGDHDAHALEMTIARLRAKLGPCRRSLRTSAGRGYRLGPD